MAVGLLVSILGCTKPNPRACSDGVCSDPAFPFCDTQGTLGGDINECIAVSCTPGEFAECRGDAEVVCDAGGTTYSVYPCRRACSEELGGCTVDPSNGFGTYIDQAQDLEDWILDTSSNVVIDTHTGQVQGGPTAVSFLAPAPPNGVPVRVFVAKHVTLNNVTVRSAQESSPALAIIALDEIVVKGNGIAFAFGSNGSSNASGAATIGALPGFDAVFGTLPGESRIVSIGSSGGGNATAGGSTGVLFRGGDPVAGSPGGMPQPDDTLVPLIGGGNAGSVEAAGLGGRGGGALQLTSLRRVVVSGPIDVRGQPGTLSGERFGGGGAGGSVLVEAPEVEVHNAMIRAYGGGGASATTDGSDNGSFSTGGLCTSSSSITCSNSGDGAWETVPAPGNGGDVNYDAGNGAVYVGAGGGALGRLRINTNLGVLPLPSANAAASVGTTKRRGE